MMLKIIGCILILISSYCLGVFKAQTYKVRTAELESILELLNLLELEITYKKEPLMKTFHKVANCKDCWFSTVLEHCSEEMVQQNPMMDAWQNAIAMHQRETPLEQQDIEILQDLALSLGKSDIQSQRRMLEPARIRLNERLAQAKELERRQGRMYRGLGLSAGVVIVIMII